MAKPKPHVDVGRRLRRIREQRGLSRSELAARTGLSDRSIVRLENGDNVFVSTYFAVRDHLCPAELSSETFEALLRMDEDTLACLLMKANR